MDMRNLVSTGGRTRSAPPAPPPAAAAPSPTAHGSPAPTSGFGGPAAPKRQRRGDGPGGAAAASADPQTFVAVDGEWGTFMQPAREAGEFIDITLLVGGRKIPAHKNVLVSFSPYLHGLLTSGLAESKQGGHELQIGDEDTDGRAVEAIVDCCYSGMLSLSNSTVSSVIRTANLLGVNSVEKAACDFFVEALEPSCGCEALAFAAAHAECGEHARALHERCVSYVVEHFAECSVEPSFLELPCEAVAELIGSDDLPVEEAAVLAAVRAWFDHLHGAEGSRAGSLATLLSLVRWPLLPVSKRLSLPTEPLLQRMMEWAPRRNCPLGMKLMMECSTEFAASDAAAGCPRLKQRKGTVTVPPVLPLAFTALSQQHYVVSENGALLTSTIQPLYRAAMCRGVVMNSRRGCAEVTVVRKDGYTMIGVGRPTLDPSARAHTTADFWGVFSYDGSLLHNSDTRHSGNWQGMQDYGTGDVLRLLLDSDAGTLTVKKNGVLLGVAVTSGLTGDLCWAVACYEAGDSVRIKAVDPADF